ncbi:ABC transporter permease [Flavitalea sp. BT771]|uniref:ABC transporter permease n=1 Tax=Flavitalea sp. BT771 TaxID=3063329 RepID=UPI0026E3350E|nr:ABC transporter permease [Flavitalea sp. BT771]MDO6432888.1 ABC transporter permease [Flavitalea sp. BT771]MDV6221836.1 FtsX-like permease family protein [Flavitalea sp. BT771]
MLKNYLKTAWRNVKKNKGFFALNFIGLYVSIVVCTLIALIILHETSFDKSDGKGIQLFRVVAKGSTATGEVYSATTPYPLATAMRAALPDERLITQIHYQGRDIVKVGDKKFMEYDIIFADSVFPRLFPMQVKAGSLQHALAEPGFAILTEKAAHRYFGNADPIGQRIKVANLVDLQIAAVVADPPSNTHMPYSLLASYRSMNRGLIGGFPIDSWSVTANGYAYIGLPGENNVKHVESQLATIAAHNLSEEGRSVKARFSLQPSQDIHFNQLYADSNITYTINYKYLSLIGAIGLFLILAACINYTNLSTALAIKKSREVGVRKTMGATRSQLMKQFFSETFFLTGAVIVAASLSISFLLPSLNTFLDKHIPLHWFNFSSALFLALLWITVSLLSGVYPALVLSGFNPITALKNKISTPRASAVTLRRGLVIFQFLTAQILIICAIVVAKQMAFIQSRPLGFDKEKVLDLSISDNNYQRQHMLIDRLSALPGVSSASLSIGAPISNNHFNSGFNLKEKFKTDPIPVKIITADRSYLKTYGLHMLTGRWFDEKDESLTAPTMPDSLRRYALVLNEQAVHRLGFASPQEALGKYVSFGLNDLSAPIVGVVKDYNVASLRETVMPVLIVQYPSLYYNIGIKFAGGISTSTLAAMEKIWSSIYPEQIFETDFLDEHVATLYKDDRRTQQLFYIFTLLSIAINVLGLIGLLSFMIEQKTKEIGIRKVLGATVKDISFILSKDFVRLIILAFLIAAPIAGYLMNKWLRDFAFRTDLSWWVFAVAVLSILCVTGLAVGFQTIRAAIANPIKSLRTE